MVKDWTTAEYVPIHKQSCPKDPIRYRPIALLLHVRTAIEAQIDTALRASTVMLSLGFEGTRVQRMVSTDLWATEMS